MYSKKGRKGATVERKRNVPATAAEGLSKKKRAERGLLYTARVVYICIERGYILCWQQSHKAQELPCLRGSSALRKMKLFEAARKAMNFDTTAISSGAVSDQET